MEGSFPIFRVRGSTISEIQEHPKTSRQQMDGSIDYYHGQHSRGKMPGNEPKEQVSQSHGFLSTQGICGRKGPIATMLGGSTVLAIVNVIIPLNLCIALGYASSKLRILPHEQTYAGLGFFNSYISLPFLVFRMISTNDPYHMDLKLIAADTIYRVAVLSVLCLNCCYRRTHQSLAWVNSLFNLATMPNSLLIGPPLLTSLYPGTDKDVTTLVFMQFSLWFCVCILLLEIHKAVYENWAESEAKDNVASENEHGISSSVKDLQQGEKQQQEPGVLTTDLAIHVQKDASSEFKDPQKKYVQNGEEKIRPTKRQFARKITQTAFLKFLLAPVVWGSILGFIYSLFNYKFNHGKALPVMLKSMIDLVANCTLGICMFMIGMSVGVAPRLFVCGVPKALLGVGVRFIVAPACMALVSFAVGLRGKMFRFAVMQAIVPQAIVSFVWATQYNVHADIFSTAVWFQTAIFLPFAVGLNLLLGLGW